MFLRVVLRRLPLLLGLAFVATQASAQIFEADFARWSGPPLVKTKFGVYQTPLTTLPRLRQSAPLLREINVSDFRYEIGWGKPESLDYSQISGASAQTVSTIPARFHYDFTAIDALTSDLRAAGVRPLLAMTYCPNPLKSRSVWEAWKDVPTDLPAWRRINRDYAAHLKNAAKGRGSFYEIWNEPDMPEPNRKMFFSGGPEDYERLYRYAASGVRSGDADALVGGPAIAYDLRYLTPLVLQSVDFASIHAYDNYAAQVRGMRGALRNNPQVPIFITEYASFKEFPPLGPQSRHWGAMRFFRDVKGLLSLTDVTKAYWAQWQDAGTSPGMGLITENGHRKALFNAFKIYGRMPVDRNRVTPESVDGIGVMASSNKRCASVVLWNETETERTVTVNLKRLPFARGALRLYRIDKNHASYVDNPASENLSVVETVLLNRAAASSATSWTGSVPAGGVVYLELLSAEKPVPPAPNSIGTYVRNYHWFPRRDTNAYADFDPKTCVARLGMDSNEDLGVAQVAAVMDNPAPRFQVLAERSGPSGKSEHNFLFGIRFDFPSKKGGYGRSALYRDGIYRPGRDAVMPWGDKGATPDKEAHPIKERSLRRSFLVDLARIAPPDWNRKRIIVTFLLRDAGRGGRAKFTLTKP